MYTFALKKYDNLDWICFIEVDEFIFPQSNINFKPYLESLKIRKQYLHGLDTSLLGCKFGQLNSKTNLF
jgi:hypothetical protein